MATARRARLSIDERREQLVGLGVDIFSERPYDEVSIDDIAAAAGISKGLLYHYFPGKRDFYVEVVRFSAAEMVELTEPDPSLDPAARLAESLDRYLDYAESHARGYLTVMRAGIGSDPEVAAVVEQVRSQLVERTLADIPHGGARPPAPLRIAVRGWIGFVEAASLDWLEHRDLPRERLRKMLAAQLGAAIEAAGT